MTVHPESSSSAVRHQIANSVGKDWDEIAMRLNRFAYWEFEDCSQA